LVSPLISVAMRETVTVGRATQTTRRKTGALV
jgi:hypothetical protein